MRAGGHTSSTSIVGHDERGPQKYLKHQWMDAPRGTQTNMRMYACAHTLSYMTRDNTHSLRQVFTAQVLRSQTCASSDEGGVGKIWSIFFRFKSENVSFGFGVKPLAE